MKIQGRVSIQYMTDCLIIHVTINVQMELLEVLDGQSMFGPIIGSSELASQVNTEGFIVVKEYLTVGKYSQIPTVVFAMSKTPTDTYLTQSMPKRSWWSRWLRCYLVAHLCT